VHCGIGTFVPERDILRSAAGSFSLTRDRLRQFRSPGRSLKAIREILGFVRDESFGVLHDANRVGGHAVVSDHALADPQIPGTEDAADDEVPIRRMTAALCPDLSPAAEPLAGLRVVQDGGGRVDRVLSFDVPALRGLPVLFQAGADAGITFHITSLLSADQTHTIRIPEHIVEMINKLGRIQRELLQDLGREPGSKELAGDMDITPEKVLEIQQYAREPISLDQTIGDEGDSRLGVSSRPPRPWTP
jgi:hypothetical protein